MTDTLDAGRRKLLLGAIQDFLSRQNFKNTARALGSELKKQGIDIPKSSEKLEDICVFSASHYDQKQKTSILGRNSSTGTQQEGTLVEQPVKSIQAEEKKKNISNATTQPNKKEESSSSTSSEESSESDESSSVSSEVTSSSSSADSSDSEKVASSSEESANKSSTTSGTSSESSSSSEESNSEHSSASSEESSEVESSSSSEESSASKSQSSESASTGDSLDSSESSSESSSTSQSASDKSSSSSSDESSSSSRSSEAKVARITTTGITKDTYETSSHKRKHVTESSQEKNSQKVETQDNMKHQDDKRKKHHTAVQISTRTESYSTPVNSHQSNNGNKILENFDSLPVAAIHEDHQESHLSEVPSTLRRFQRIEENTVKFHDDKLRNNSYDAKGGEQYGLRAWEELKRVQGKDFRKAKTKKKRATYFGGGTISQNVNSFRFTYSDEGE